MFESTKITPTVRIDSLARSRRASDRCPEPETRGVQPRVSPPAFCALESWARFRARGAAPDAPTRRLSSVGDARTAGFRQVPDRVAEPGGAYSCHESSRLIFSSRLGESRRPCAVRLHLPRGPRRLSNGAPPASPHGCCCHRSGGMRMASQMRRRAFGMRARPCSILSRSADSDIGSQSVISDQDPLCSRVGSPIAGNEAPDAQGQREHYDCAAILTQPCGL